MLENTENPVLWTDEVDSEMAAAMAQARSTFKYFWRELTWEYRRIIPALELSAIKAAFRDTRDDSTPVEHMWLSEIRFNGDCLVATLMNSPSRLRSVKEGEVVTLRLNQLEDWMYVMRGTVFGGFTIQRLRATMPTAERRNHDQAWGFTFPDPRRVELVPNWFAVSKPSRLARVFGGKLEPRNDPEQEHPMSENMADDLAEAIDRDPEGFLRSRDEDGLTTLHSFALGGSAAAVKVLLAKGSDPTTRTNAGYTPLDLAEMMGWPRVAAILRAATSDSVLA